MPRFKSGDIVKSITDNKEYRISKSEISRSKFNKNALDYILTDKTLSHEDEESMYTYICLVEEPNGMISKHEFQSKDLTLVRSGQ